MDPLLVSAAQACFMLSAGDLGIFGLQKLVGYLGGSMDNLTTLLEQQLRTIVSFLPSLLAAILILIVGYILARIVSAAIRGLLRRTNLDNRIAASVGGTDVNIENGVSTVVFWLIMLFVLIGVFQALNLAIVSAPLNELLQQVLGFIPRLLGAGVILLIAWVVATVLRRLVVGVLGRNSVDRRLRGLVSGDDDPGARGAVGAPVRAVEAPGTTAPQLSIGETLGDVIYWLVFLLFLPAVLSTLELDGVLTPVQELLNRVFAYLPNIVAAALILVVGWFVARIVQRIVTSLLAAAGVDRLAERFGLSGVLGGQRVSSLLGLVVHVFILLPVIISALNALRIDAVTQPATNMLNTFLAAIPNIFAAAVVLIISYVVGRLVAGLVSNLLAGLGFNTLPARLGLASGSPAVGDRTPSGIVGSLTLIAIMLFATVEAVRLLGFAVLADLLAQFIQLGGQIILGLIVFGVGLYLANLAAGLIRSSRAANAGLLAMTARAAIIVLAAAMALRQMGIANEIVNLAFGLLLGAIAVAAAIAFGFGGREIAGRELETWVQRMKSGSVPGMTPGVSESSLRSASSPGPVHQNDATTAPGRQPLA
jgi:hypothetical protein